MKDRRDVKMKIIRTKDYQDMSRKAANIISAQMILKDDSVLGLATGSTPIGIYDQLVDWYKKGDLDFSKITTVNLDEYKGLPKENDQSYWYFMNKNLSAKLTLKRIAGEAGYSSTYFTTLFRNETGYSPLSYFSHLKILKATELLDYTRTKVKAISFEFLQYKHIQQ